MLAVCFWICRKRHHLIYEMSFCSRAVAARHAELQASLIVATV